MKRDQFIVYFLAALTVALVAKFMVLNINAAPKWF